MTVRELLNRLTEIINIDQSHAKYEVRDMSGDVIELVFLHGPEDIDEGDGHVTLEPFFE